MLEGTLGRSVANLSAFAAVLVLVLRMAYGLASLVGGRGMLVFRISGCLDVLEAVCMRQNLSGHPFDLTKLWPDRLPITLH